MSNTSTGIVVVGANGFVGKNLRSFLYENKLNVLAISRKNFQKHSSEIKIISTNISEPKLQTKLKNYSALITSFVRFRLISSNVDFGVCLPMPIKLIKAS